MRKRLLFLGAIVGAGTLAFFAFSLLTNQKRILEQSEQFTLYSLQPVMEVYSRRPNASALLQEKETFHNHLVLGKVQITNPKLRADLVETLYRGMEGIGVREQANCFNPRHGIRAVKNGCTVDVVICFECKQLDFYEGKGRKHSPVSRTPQTLFDKVLIEAQIPRSKRPY